MSDYGYRADNQVGTGFKSQESILATNKVLKNTYLLLSMTLLFSAATAAVSMAMNIPQGAALILMLVSFGCYSGCTSLRILPPGLLLFLPLPAVLAHLLGPCLIIMLPPFPMARC